MTIAALDEVTAGSWPDWLAAVGTTLAFVVAAVAYWRDVRLRRQSQARLVYARLTALAGVAAGSTFQYPADAARGYGDARWMPVQLVSGEVQFMAAEDAMSVAVAIHNGSEELIPKAFVEALHDGPNREPWPTPVDVDLAMPRSDTIVHLLLSAPGAPGIQPGILLRLTFQDATGHWWTRTASAPVKKAKPEHVRRLTGRTGGERAGRSLVRRMATWLQRVWVFRSNGAAKH